MAQDVLLNAIAFVTSKKIEGGLERATVEFLDRQREDFRALAQRLADATTALGPAAIAVRVALTQSQFVLVALAVIRKNRDDAQVLSSMLPSPHRDAFAAAHEEWEAFSAALDACDPRTRKVRVASDTSAAPAVLLAA